jgi:hypothetical protein
MHRSNHHVGFLRFHLYILLYSYIYYDRYAERLQSQGKLIGLDEYDTYHVGITPPMSKGGPGENATERIIQVLIDHLS